MKSLLALAILAIAAAVDARESSPPSVRPVDMMSVDGLILKGTYFAAAKPGPAVLLFHQANRTRTAWEAVASELAAVGIHTLTIDMRGQGETGGATNQNRDERRRLWRADVDAAFDFLSLQPGVRRDVIGLGGAGVDGVEDAVETARRHSAPIKSLALLSGETGPEGLRFLHDSWQLPGLFVTSDRDEYPPTVEAMELLYVTASSPSKKLIHYSASTEAPWLWYEPFDVGRVPPTGNHGTDLFETHLELPGILVHWFVTTLLRTPGHAPAETVACAASLDRVRERGGVAAVTEELAKRRKKDREAQLFPEITMSIIGQNHLRAGEPKEAIEIFELIALAYPDSADNEENLSEAYLGDGRADLARRHAEKAIAMLDSHAAPASSWTDTNEYRGEIRKGAQKVLEKVATGTPK